MGYSYVAWKGKLRFRALEGAFGFAGESTLFRMALRRA